MVSNTKKEKSSKQHKHRSDHDRVEKTRERERRSPSNDDKSRSPTPTHSNEPSNPTREGTERMSLSIDETNKVRASLGLKPLTIDGNSTADSDTQKKSLNSDENFVHRPPENLTEKKRTEELTRKLSERKETRTLQGKFLTTPTIASESAEPATSWVEKMRQMDGEKRKAAERAKLLEQMDEEFGVGNLIDEESEKRKQKRYVPKDLTGLRVEHSIEEFKEGQPVVLTLKDKKILRDEKDDDDEEDVLINVNIADNEVAKQRADLTKKKTPGYRAYKDDESADQFGMLNPDNLLEQYDEKKKSSFRLESGGIYDMSDEKIMDNMKQEIRTRMQSLIVPAPKVASEFYSATEMEQFKKPKKVTKKKIRSRKMLKADDLLAMDSSEPRESSTTSVFLRPAEIRRSTAIASTSKEHPAKISLDKIKRKLITTTTTEDEDILGPSDDLSNVVIEDDAFDELQAIVNKTMKLKTKKDSLSAERALNELIEERDRKLKLEIKSEPMETGIIIPPGPVPLDDKNLVLDTMSEFCRNVGENAIDATSNVPTLRTSSKIKRTNVASTKKSKSKNSVALDPDDELLQHAMENDDLDDDAMDDTPAENVNTKPFRLEDSILSSEAILDRGLGSALQLAMQKGYIEQEKSRQNARFVSDISAKHITVEEKNSYEIEDKHARRDRYTSGPLTDFKEKEHYRPDVKLEYVDEGGRRMNEKEAFRFLSHRFHGKGSGKKKTEKRARKQAEEELMKKMSSVDTPLQTCNLLKQKQIQLQQPYIVLSASRSKDSQFPPGSITKN
jgi:U4/U6.U5 tri-snRNP-associated protein 1